MSKQKLRGLFVKPSIAMEVVEPVVSMVGRSIRSSRMPQIPGALRNLGNWMASLVRGNAVDERPPIWADVPRSQVEAHLNASINAHTQKVTSLNARVPGFSRIWSMVEKDQAKNIGPSSMYPSFLVDGEKKLDAVFSDKPLSTLSINSSAYRRALKDIEDLVPAGSLRAVHMNSVTPNSDSPSKSRLDGSTNAGCPYWGSGWWQLTRKDPAHQMFRQWLHDEVQSLIKACYQASDWKTVVPRLPATTGQRVVSKGPDPFIPTKEGTYKVRRFVIAMPKWETWAGKTLFVPEQDALLKVINPLAPVRLMSGWVPLQSIDRNMQNMLEYAHNHKLTVLSGDISNFDASVPPDAWWDVKQAMSKWFAPDERKLFLAISYADIYNTILICPTKIYEAQPSSVKSGSIFTNVDDSIFNYFVQRYGYHSGYYGDPVSAVNGDDIVAVAPDLVPESMSRAFADFGMDMNVEKQFYEPDALHFLQRLHVLGIPGGMGSVYRVLGKCLAVEDDTQLRYDERNKFAYAVQAISRLENANFNPMFEELVELIAAGDYKLHLGRGMPAQQVASGAGEYAKRKFTEEQRNVWSPAGSGVPFQFWAVNRVLRGARLPPPGRDRWKAIYGTEWSSAHI